MTFRSGGVARLTIPATGDACTDVLSYSLLLGEFTRDLFGIGVKLGETSTTDEAEPLGFGSVSLIVLSFGGFFKFML